MNAGAYGGEMKDVLTKGVTIDRQGNTHEYKQGGMELSYRNSIFIRKQEIILSAEMKLCEGDAEEMTQKVNELLAKRKEKQPLEYPSAGSTFKRPEGDFAGRLIEECGLKGKGVNAERVGSRKGSSARGLLTAAETRSCWQPKSPSYPATEGCPHRMCEPALKPLWGGWAPITSTCITPTNSTPASRSLSPWLPSQTSSGPD